MSDRVEIRWPKRAVLPAESLARLVCRTLACGEDWRHARAPELCLFDYREWPLPITAGHVLAHLAAQGTPVDPDDLDALGDTELAAVYGEAKRWLEQVVEDVRNGRVPLPEMMIRTRPTRLST